MDEQKLDPGSWETLDIEELRIVVRNLVTELRAVESVLIAAIGADKVDAAATILAPARYMKYRHEDRGSTICDTDPNPGPKWKRICGGKTWSNQGECDRDSCT